MVDGVKPPQRRPVVAEIVNDHEGEVGNDGRQKELREERPFIRPYREEPSWPHVENPCDDGDQEDADDIAALVYEGMPDAGFPVAAFVVPLLVGRGDSLSEIRAAKSAEKEDGEPAIKVVAGNDCVGRAIEAEEHGGDVAVAHDGHEG